MSKQLSQVPYSEITQLLQTNYQSVHAKLGEVLSGEEWAFFAKPIAKKASMAWLTDHRQLQSLASASEEEKDLVQEQIHELRRTMLPKISTDPTLAAIVQDLFIIPSDADIHYAIEANGEIRVSLAKWACRSALGKADANPLKKFVNRPKKDHSNVIVELSYSDGLPFAQEDFEFHYKDRATKIHQTDEEGRSHIGQLKNGVAFSISQINSPDLPQTATVTEGSGLYAFVFPHYIDFEILVVDQEGSVLPNFSFETEHEGQPHQYVTDAEGIVDVKNHPLSKSAYLLKKEGATQSQYLDRDTDRILFEVPQKQYESITIQVINEAEEPVKNHPIQININGSELSFESDANGQVALGEREVGTAATVVDAYDQHNRQEFVVEKGVAEWRFTVVPKIVNVKLVNHRNKALGGVPMDFAIGGENHLKKTNEEGICNFPYPLFQAGEKIDTRIHLPAKGRKKAKEITKSFKFDAEQLEYVIKLRKFPWWILLLLLPLLLFIKCEKEIYVKTIDATSSTRVANVDVQFDYTQAFLLDKGQFFRSNFEQLNTKSDSMGIATFAPLRYSVYSFIFRYPSKAIIFGQNDCFASDTLSSRYHGIWNKDTLELPLYPSRAELELVVLDSLTNKPIDQAKVIASSTYNAYESRDSSLTNANGLAALEVNKCGQLQKAIASADGYYPDSLLDKEVAELLDASVEERTIRLRPKMKRLLFRTVEAKDSSIIVPNANVEVTVTYNRAIVSGQLDLPISSDEQGEFVVEVPELAKISIRASKPGYGSNSKKIRDRAVIDLIDILQGERDIPLLKDPPPRENCRIFVSDVFVADFYGFITDRFGFSEIYKADDYSEYVGEGEYPMNELAFPKVANPPHTFDGIAIDKGTRVIIFEKPNFRGDTLLDQIGPAIINNGVFRDRPEVQDWQTKIFKEPLQTNYPPSVRFYSETNMQEWSKGSIKVMCYE